jgi:hypothetical protein
MRFSAFLLFISLNMNPQPAMVANKKEDGEYSFFEALSFETKEPSVLISGEELL